MPTNGSTSKLKTHIKDITLLFGVPVTIILIIVAFLYVPRLFAHPGYDFIYCSGYSCGERYSVDASGSVTEVPSDRKYSFEASTLYYFDIERDTARPLQQDGEATKYKLDPTLKSPDGYTLKHNTGSGGFFGGSYRNNWSLSKGLITKPVSLDANASNKQFIGWVVK